MWWPQHDTEPGDAVLAVAMYGHDPDFLRVVRVHGRWYRRGLGAGDSEPRAPVPRTRRLHLCRYRHHRVAAHRSDGYGRRTVGAG